MKKFLVLLLALVMVFSFAACGGGSDEPQTPDADAAGTDLEYVEGSIDLSNVIEENRIVSEFSAADRAKLKEEAAAEGIDVDFAADGSTTFRYPDGSVAVQGKDGVWTVTDGETGTDYQVAQGAWPQNEYSAKLPEPGFGEIAFAGGDSTEGFAAEINGCTREDFNVYVSACKNMGYTNEATDMPEMGIFSATSNEGFTVVVMLDDTGKLTIGLSEDY